MHRAIDGADETLHGRLLLIDQSPQPTHSSPDKRPLILLR
jgi:hypothetical protein